MTITRQMRRPLLLTLCTFLLLASAALPELQPAPVRAFAPELRSINPDAAPAGREVTIKGRDFTSDESQVTVLFGDTEAVVRKSKRKKITVVVPATLEPGTYQVLVSVAGQVSNSEPFQVLPSIIPIAGEYVGRTDQGRRFSFEVFHFSGAQIATRLRTTFDCQSGTCVIVLPVSIDRLMDIEGAHFETTISGQNFSAEIEGEFTSEVEAEGTARFIISGPCGCDTGTIRWSVSRN